MISITKLLMDTPNFGDSLRYQPHAHKATNGVGAGRGPVVVWNCTKTCNLKCVHCYARSEAIKYQNELTHEEGIKLIDQLADFHVPVILFSGGEPAQGDGRWLCGHQFGWLRRDSRQVPRQAGRVPDGFARDPQLCGDGPEGRSPLHDYEVQLSRPERYFRFTRSGKH